VRFSPLPTATDHAGRLDLETPGEGWKFRAERAFRTSLPPDAGATTPPEPFQAGVVA
jgi:hypothetical protein